MSDPRNEARREPFEFGKYQILEEIGRGGMGVVYKARQKDLDRPVAIKMILASHVASPEQVTRLQSEAQAAAQVNHPNIVGVIEIGSHNGQHFLVMEFIEGKSLAELLEEGSIGLRDCAGVVADVAHAVHELHEQGILHRDLKPSNILIDSDGRPFVTDFGLAHGLGEESANSDGGGRLIGTPGYMAPELVAGSSAACPKSDVYSLGAVLYEAATGKAPFGDDTPVDRLMNVIDKEPPPPRTLDRGVPVAVETVILACIARRPERRYETAAALSADLKCWLSGQPMEVVPPAGLHRLRRWIRRHPALGARLLGFGAFFAIALGFETQPYVGQVGALLGLWAAASLAC